MARLIPCIKIAPEFPGRQLDHIKSEVSEVDEAYFKYFKLRYLSPDEDHKEALEHLAEELVDVQTSCETMLRLIGYGEQKADNVRRKVAKKNKERGYHDS